MLFDKIIYQKCLQKGKFCSNLDSAKDSLQNKIKINLVIGDDG